MRVVKGVGINYSIDTSSVRSEEESRIARLVRDYIPNYPLEFCYLTAEGDKCRCFFTFKGDPKTAMKVRQEVEKALSVPFGSFVEVLFVI